MRLWKAKRKLVSVSILLGLVVAGRASAVCHVCDPFLHCIESWPGARLCVEGPASCALLLPCVGGGERTDADGGASSEQLTTWSLYDADGTAPRSGASLSVDAGGLALGEDLRAEAGSGALGRLADAALAHGGEWAIVLANEAGDGFALKRASEGEFARLEVRELHGDVPGAVLANALLGPRDRLSVPVRVAGRDRMLVLQTARVNGPAVGAELARLRRSLAAAGRVLPARTTPLLELSPQR